MIYLVIKLFDLAQGPSVTKVCDQALCRVLVLFPGRGGLTSPTCYLVKTPGIGRSRSGVHERISFLVPAGCPVGSNSATTLCDLTTCPSSASATRVLSCLALLSTFCDHAL